MIDKIIEELQREIRTIMDTYVGSMQDDIFSELETLEQETIFEIAKKYENDGWILCSERLPEIETILGNKINYLACCGADNYLITGYCEGWNCFRDFDGEVSKINEITSVIAWKELELYKEIQNEPKKN